MGRPEKYPLGGYVGRILVVDLTAHRYEVQPLAVEDAVTLIGGYGTGAKYLYLHQRAGVDPLGPENILGFTTGPFTGSTVPTGTRWTVVTKSPLTGTWGDSNAGGWFGQCLKASGFDAVYFFGKAPRPTYVLIDGGEATFHDAADLWGLDTFETEDRLTERYGKDAQIACIGPAGERLSLISGIVHAKGRVAARSGVGAVMGAKHLKAVVLIGKTAPMVGDSTRIAKQKFVGQMRNGVGFSMFYQTTGTPGAIVNCVKTGDAPIRNWSGAPSDFPDVEKIGAEAMFRKGRRKRTCWGCPLACWGEVRLDGQLVPQPEYETAAAFGSLQLVSDLNAILKSNELCNRYGLDTISTGATIAFAMECYEKGLINERDVGFPLEWGDGLAATRLVGEIALRKGFGEILADGSARAARSLGGDAEGLAVHIMGQELGMHDPRLEPGIGLVYLADATPGRHNQANSFLPVIGLDIGFTEYGKAIADQVGRGALLKTLGGLFHVLQAAGGCQFGYLSTTVDFVPESLSAVTGHHYSLEDVLSCGERIANVRQGFNVREGINMLETRLPDRAYGRPPLTNGPTKGVTVRLNEMLDEYLKQMEWSRDAAIPGERRLRELGLDFLADDLHASVARAEGG